MRLNQYFPIVMRLPRTLYGSSLIEGLLPPRLSVALRENPYGYRLRASADSTLSRRTRSLLPVALAGAVFLMFVLMSGFGFHSTSLLLELYVPLRLLLLYRTARLTVSASRQDLLPGNLEHLAASPIRGCDLILGWAMAGWSRTVPETFAVLVFLSPLMLTSGFVGGFIALVDIGHLVLLQGLAALITAGLMAGFQYRHEAVTAGWVSAVFTYPLVFFLQATILGMLLALLPLSVVLLIGASSPAGWPELEGAVVARSGIWLFVAAYALWLPVATMKEIDRQLDLASRHLNEGLQKYLHYDSLSPKANQS